MTVNDALRWAGVEVRHKSTSYLMRVLTVVLGWVGLDFNRFWTTVSRRVIYAPNHVDLSDLERHRVIIQHELVHIRQARRWPVLFQVSYLLLPLPVGLAWFRFYWERHAYLVDIHAGRLTVEDVVQTLWSNYGWVWPKPWMRRWFERKLAAHLLGGGR